MIPEQFIAGEARVAAAHSMRTALQNNSSGGSTRYGRVATSEVDITHGRILYLENVNGHFYKSPVLR